MQETNKAKISMSLFGRQRGERSSHSFFPRPSEEGQLAKMSRSHQDKSSGHLGPLPGEKPWFRVCQAHHSLGLQL